MPELEGIELPLDFYNYLTTVSDNYIFAVDTNYKNSDFTVEFYDKIISATNGENETISIVDNVKGEDKIDLKYVKRNDFILPLDVTNLSYYFPECRVSEDDISVTTCNNINISEIECNFVQISRGQFGMFPNFIYLGSGPHFGSIWSNGDDSNYGECPMYEKIFDNFTDYLNRINYIKENATYSRLYSNFSYGDILLNSDTESESESD